MKESSVSPEEHTFSLILNVIGELLNMEEGRHVHDQLINDIY